MKHQVASALNLLRESDRLCSSLSNRSLTDLRLVLFSHLYSNSGMHRHTHPLSTTYLPRTRYYTFPLQLANSDHLCSLPIQTIFAGTPGFLHSRFHPFGHAQTETPSHSSHPKIESLGGAWDGQGWESWIEERTINIILSRLGSWHGDLCTLPPLMFSQQ